MILQTDVSFVVFTAAVQQQFVGFRPFVLAEFAVVEHLFPFRGPQVVFHDLRAVLEVSHGSVIYEDFGRIPFAERFRVLRFRRDHVVQRSGLAVAVDA